MTPKEWREQCSAYVLGALDADERVAFEQYLATRADADDQAELERMQRVARALESTLPAPRSASALWRRIDDALPPAARREGARGPRAREVAAWTLAAAAAGVAIWQWTRAGHEAQAVTAQRELRLAAERRGADIMARADAELGACAKQLQDLQGDPTRELKGELVGALEHGDTQVVPFGAAGEPGKALEARWVYHAASHRGWVLGRGFTAQPGKTYQLWTIRGTAAPAPAGTAIVDDRGALVARFAPEALAAGVPDAVAVSLESDATDATPEVVLLVAKKS